MKDSHYEPGWNLFKLNPALGKIFLKIGADLKTPFLTSGQPLLSLSSILSFVI